MRHNLITVLYNWISFKNANALLETSVADVNDFHYIIMQYVINDGKMRKTLCLRLVILTPSRAIPLPPSPPSRCSPGRYPILRDNWHSGLNFHPCSSSPSKGTERKRHRRSHGRCVVRRRRHRRRVVDDDRREWRRTRSLRSRVKFAERCFAIQWKNPILA